MSTHAMRALVPCRPLIDQNFYYAGLKFTSPTFSCAMSNMLPAMTFIMAVLFRYSPMHIHTHQDKQESAPTI